MHSNFLTLLRRTLSIFIVVLPVLFLSLVSHSILLTSLMLYFFRFHYHNLSLRLYLCLSHSLFFVRFLYLSLLSIWDLFSLSPQTLLFSPSLSHSLSLFPFLSFTIHLSCIFLPIINYSLIFLHYLRSRNCPHNWDL